jgi:predicted nucleotidyltransferase
MTTIIDHTIIDVPPDAISAFCKRHHIQELSLFGSVLRPDFGPDSDIDVLAEFEPEAMSRAGFPSFDSFRTRCPGWRC